MINNKIKFKLTLEQEEYLQEVSNNDYFKIIWSNENEMMIAFIQNNKGYPVLLNSKGLIRISGRPKKIYKNSKSIYFMSAGGRVDLV